MIDVTQSPAHALVYGLRKPSDETQLTNVVAAIGRTDKEFCRAFVCAILDQAREDCRATLAAQRRLGEVPIKVVVARERELRDEAGGSLGNVDLMFESAGREGEFTLLVENKLYSP